MLNLRYADDITFIAGTIKQLLLEKLRFEA